MKQHIHEHETLQLLQQYALNGNDKSFFDLLMSIDGEDKRKDIMELCDMSESQFKDYKRDRYNESFGITRKEEVHGNSLSEEENI